MKTFIRLYGVEYRGGDVNGQPIEEETDVLAEAEVTAIPKEELKRLLTRFAGKLNSENRILWQPLHNDNMKRTDIQHECHLTRVESNLPT